eukprot:6485947-Amphidinium_carterae.2
MESGRQGAACSSAPLSIKEVLFWVQPESNYRMKSRDKSSAKWVLLVLDLHYLGVSHEGLATTI